MKPDLVPSSLFRRNRSKLAAMMLPRSVVLIRSGEAKIRSGDQHYPYRQHSNFFYLTGHMQEENLFAFSPDHPNVDLREVLFIRKATAKSDLWTGPLPGPDEVQELSGIAQVRYLEEKEAILELLLQDASVVYCDQELAALSSKARFRELKELNKMLLHPLLMQLRMIKEPEEVQAIRHAISITHSAFLELMGHVRPGVWEYQLEAEIIGSFIRKGAAGHAYDPIVASGKNALILHYVKNSSQCLDGDLLLMDFGAEVNNYAADCSRTIPVNGRFTKRQREVYEAVLRVFRQARDMMVPGTLLADFHQEVGALWEEEHIALGLYSQEDSKVEPDQDALWKLYYMHGTSHSLGLDVHDPFDRSRVFEAGMVLTCEPAIYIPEEQIGIRLENNILIGTEGPVDLMEGIPIEANAIEELMNSKG
jgi:Xaa-Pro aminopeptidase